MERKKRRIIIGSFVLLLAVTVWCLDVFTLRGRFIYCRTPASLVADDTAIMSALISQNTRPSGSSTGRPTVYLGEITIPPDMESADSVPYTVMDALRRRNRFSAGLEGASLTDSAHIVHAMPYVGAVPMMEFSLPVYSWDGQEAIIFEVYHSGRGMGSFAYYVRMAKRGGVWAQADVLGGTAS